MEKHLDKSRYQKTTYNVVPITVALVMSGFLCMLNKTLLNMELIGIISCFRQLAKFQITFCS